MSPAGIYSREVRRTGPTLARARALAWTVGLVPLALLSLVWGAPCVAAEAEILRVAGRAAVLEGEVDGTSVGPLGRLTSAPRVERLIGFDEPFVFSAASAERGWILGTGNEGKVFFANREGGTRVIARLPQPEVFAVHGRADGSIVAAGSPDARVYQVAGGGAVEELFDPEATYVWALAEDSRGRLLAATGLPGKLVRFDGERLETLYQSPDAHVRSLLVRDDDTIWLGTAGQGLVVRIEPDGTARTVHDADEPEVTAFADAGDVVYAALLASEASWVDLSGQDGEGEGSDGSPAPTIGSRSGDHEGPRSVVLALEAGGDGIVPAERKAELTDETVHALGVFGGDLWIATGQSGHLYRLRGDELIREAELEDRQLVALAEGPGAEGDERVLGVVTTNGAGIYRVDGSRRSEGLYSSKIHDLGRPADLGVFRWQGRRSSGSAVSASFRTGMSSQPDATWTEWTVPAKLDADEELSLAGLSGRFLQWRLTLGAGTAEGPEIRATELSYRQRNRAPEITSFEVRDPGTILAAQSFNPTSTTFEPWSPNRDGIFTSLRKEREGGQLKTLWKKGYRTLEWEAEDPNEDELTYTLDVRREGSDGPWTTMADGLEDTWFSFDSTVLPDGAYLFRLSADDRADNGEARALVSREVSEPTVVDHTPPAVVDRSLNGGTVTLDVVDERSPIVDAVWSVDAGPWQPARSADGLLDSRRERLILDLPEGGGWVLLRLTDAAFNVVTLDLSDD